MRAPPKKPPLKTKKPWADFIDAKSLMATILGGLLVLIVSLLSTYVMEESRAKAEQIREATLDIQTADSFAREESSLPDAIRYYNDALSKLSKKDDASYYADVETGLALCYLKQAQKNNGQESAQQAVDALKDVIAILKKLYGKNLQDADRARVSKVLNALGNSLSVLSDVKERVPYLEACIELHTIALNASRSQNDPEFSATILMNLGSEYLRLAEETDRPENSKLALADSQESLKFFDPKDHPLEYVKLNNGIGRAFLNLSESSDRGENIRQSLGAYEAAAKVASLDNDPEGYAITQMDIGEALTGLYQLRNERTVLTDSLRAFRNSLLVLKQDTHPYYYATVQNDIAKNYGYLFECTKRTDFLNQALDAEKEAMNIFKPDTYPYNYLTMKLVLGNIFGLYASVKDPKDNFSRAIVSYTDGLNVGKPEKYPYDYAKLMYNLALVCSQMSRLEDPEQNLLAAVRDCQEALKVWTPDNYPLDYARALLSLGNDFVLLSKIPGKENQRGLALQAYSQAAEVYQKQNLPEDYRMVLSLINRLKKGRSVSNALPSTPAPSSSGTKL